MLFYLLVAYGLCFSFQNKLPFLYTERCRELGEPQSFFDKFLHCTFCVGFHCGWMVWLLAWATTGNQPAQGWNMIPSMFLWAFGSAGFCYAADALIKWLETNTE